MNECETGSEKDFQRKTALRAEERLGRAEVGGCGREFQADWAANPPPWRPVLGVLKEPEGLLGGGGLG